MRLNESVQAVQGVKGRLTVRDVDWNALVRRRVGEVLSRVGCTLSIEGQERCEDVSDGLKYTYKFFDYGQPLVAVLSFEGNTVRVTGTLPDPP